MKRSCTPVDPLVVSGVTAFPLEIETRYLAQVRVPGIAGWIRRVHAGLADTGRRYPYLAYGTDWLGHIRVLAAQGERQEPSVRVPATTSLPSLPQR